MTDHKFKVIGSIKLDEDCPTRAEIQFISSMGGEKTLVQCTNAGEVAWVIHAMEDAISRLLKRAYMKGLQDADNRTVPMNIKG